MRLTSSMESGCTCPVLPSISHLNPSTKPRTSEPPSRLRMVTAPITLLIPGAGPPPTSMPTMGREAFMIVELYVLSYGMDMPRAIAAAVRIIRIQAVRQDAPDPDGSPRRLKSARHLLTIPGKKKTTTDSVDV